MAKLKIIPKIENLPRETKIEAENIENLISKLHEKFNVPRKKYNKYLDKETTPFRGLVVLRNGDSVGKFDENGYEALSEVDQSIKDGDEVVIVFPASGG